MKGFELYILAFVPQQVHHHLEVLFRRDVTGHDGKVGPVQQYFSEEFQRLPFRDIVCRLDQCSVGAKELYSRAQSTSLSILCLTDPVVILFEIFRCHRFMPCEHFLHHRSAAIMRRYSEAHFEVSLRIARYPKCSLFDIFDKVVESASSQQTVDVCKW